MSVDQPRPFKRFLHTWRRELIRGGVLFGLVVCGGLFIRNASHNVKDHIPHALGAIGSFGDFEWGDGDGGGLFGGGREVGDPWEYNTTLKASQQVWIRNTNGPIDVMPSEGDELHVRAEKSWRRSSPGSVELIAVPSHNGVTICAVWEAKERRCGENGDYRMNGVRKNDVAVRFHVMLPAGVRVNVQTVNGGLEIAGASAPVEANTVNGRIGVHTTTGPVEATTVNGSIEAIMMEELTGGDMNLTTVNGSVSAGLPRRINANIEAETVNGRVEADIPVKVQGKISAKHLRGIIGNGGQTLKLTTVNGSITIHEAGADVRPVLAPVARPAKPARTPRPDPAPKPSQP